MFWADAREDYIAVADLEGRNPRIVLSRGDNTNARLHHIFALTVFEGINSKNINVSTNIYQNIWFSSLYLLAADLKMKKI